jgi:Putative beta-barrel porin-2, OmpL-like. bbp2
MRLAIVILAMSSSPVAHALPEQPDPDDGPAAPTDEPEREPQPEVAPEPPEPSKQAPVNDQLAKRVDDEIEDRTKNVDKLDRRIKAVRQDLHDMEWLLHFITVFVDVGAFSVGGNGSGIRSDAFHIYYPQYKNTLSGQWVFMGDPLSTAINANGEPADTSNSREVTTDTVNSSGRPSMIVNSIGLTFGRAVTDEVALEALVEFLPRPGPDLIDIELAHIDYRPTHEYDLVIQAGKIDSVLGIEYRNQDAPKRTTVTPSLICRYTCGRQLGVRAHLVEGNWSASASVTNGDFFDERFEPDDQLKANQVPTVAGHIQRKFPIGEKLWVGASTMVGPQDGQSRLAIHQWHYGVDAKLHNLDGWSFVAEFVQGKQQGSTTGNPVQDAMIGEDRPRCDLAPCLTYKGAYLLVDRKVTDWLQPYVRTDWRDAVHRNGAQFVYESHTVRSTIGVHFGTGSVIGKVEYTWNRELGVPQFPHDVITSSLVVSMD